MNKLTTTLAVLGVGTTLSLGVMVAPAQAAIIGDSVNYSLGLQNGGSPLGIQLDPFFTGSFTASATPVNSPIYNFNALGFNFSGTLTFAATGPEQLKVTWTQIPGVSGIPVGGLDEINRPLYLTLSDLDWVPTPGTIVGASVAWVPGPPTITLPPFLGGAQLPPTTPTPNISFTGDSVTLLFDNASLTELIRSGSMATIDLNVEKVPEPLTILGAGTALGFGTLFKKKLAKNKGDKA